jgi:glycosyltransferase involved in cell wall biosynthesis
MAGAFNCLLKLDAAIRQFKPDIIHVHSLSMCPYIKFIQLLHQIPFVSTCHLEPVTKRLNIKFGEIATKHFSTIFGNRVIAISSNLKDIFVEYIKVPPKNIKLIYHGIDNNYFRLPSPEERLEAREAFKLAPNSKVICLIGRLAPVKGHDVLIQSLSILKTKGINAIALFAGKGYEKEEDAIRAYAAFLESTAKIRSPATSIALTISFESASGLYGKFTRHCISLVLLQLL